MMRFLCLILMCCASVTADAQQPQDPPGPVLRASLEPQRVVVGQKATVHIEVLAPNYMTSPPVVPDFQIHNAVTRAPSARNLSEQHNGVTFAGIVFDIAIYPLEPGSYRIANQSVGVTYAMAPPATRNVVLPMPELHFDAYIPDQAQQLDPFVSATGLSIRQDIQQSSQPLMPGGSVVRTVTIQAEGTPAMLLQPTLFTPINGTKLYLDQPQINDKSGNRMVALSAERIDRATYMIERPGDIVLPEIEVSWWNVERQSVEKSRLGSAVIHVADAPETQSPKRGSVPSATRRVTLYLFDHWSVLLLIAVATAGAVWMGPKLARMVRSDIQQRRAAYRNSEAWAFKALRRAAHHGNAADIYAALLQWLQRFDPIAPQYTVGAFRALAHDARLDHEILQIEERLYAAKPPLGAWSSRALVLQVSAARRRLRRAKASAARSVSLLPTINPRSDDEPRPNHQREKAA